MLADLVPSLIRTYVPLGVGAALTFIARAIGIGIDAQSSAVVIGVAVAIVSGVYYLVVRLLEARWPALGRVLLALGVVAKQPTYVLAAAAPSNDRTDRSGYR